MTFTRVNFAILVSVRAPGPNGTIPGELVQAGSGLNISSDDINFTQATPDSFLISPADVYTDIVEGSLAATFVSSTLFQIFQETSTQFDNFTRLIFVVYDINSTLFQDPSEGSTNSVILSFLRSPQQGPAPEDLVEPVKFQFQANRVKRVLVVMAMHGNCVGHADNAWSHHYAPRCCTAFRLLQL